MKSIKYASLATLTLFALSTLAGPAQADHLGGMTVSQTGTNGLEVTITAEITLTGNCCGGSFNWDTGDGASGSVADGVSNGVYTGDASGTGTLSDGRSFSWEHRSPAPTKVHVIVSYSYNAHGTYTVDWNDCCPGHSGSLQVSTGGSNPPPPTGICSVIPPIVIKPGQVEVGAMIRVVGPGMEFC